MILELAGRAAQVLVALAGAYLVVLWFALIVWTFRDIESRSRSVFTQVFSTLLSVLFFVPGVLLYILLRPKETLDEAFQRSLEEEYLLQDLEELPHCPSCHRYIEDDFVLCPHCHSQLREPCSSCERLVDLRWPLCPYCGVVQSEQGDSGDKVEPPAARWTAPGLRRRRTPEVPGRSRSLPSGFEDEHEEVAMLIPSRRAVRFGADDLGEDDGASFAASLASGMRSITRPFDRLLGRGTQVDEDDKGQPGPYVNGNGRHDHDSNDNPTVAADVTGAGYRRDELTAVNEPLILPRNRFASNGATSIENGATLGGHEPFGNGAGDGLSDPVVPFPSESERGERKVEPAPVRWPPRDQGPKR